MTVGSTWVVAKLTPAAMRPPWVPMLVALAESADEAMTVTVLAPMPPLAFFTFPSRWALRIPLESAVVTVAPSAIAPRERPYASAFASA